MSCAGCPYISVDGISSKYQFYERQAHFAIELRTRIAEHEEGLPGRIDYLESLARDEDYLVGTAYFMSGQRIWFMLRLSNGTTGGLTYGYCDCPPQESCITQQ